MLARFDIVLVAFPFTDGPDVKPRPAMVICLSERHQDVLLAFISSKIAGAANSDELAIRADHPQFHQSGLKVSSRCRLSRLSRLTTLALPLVRRRIGRLPEDLRPGCVQILREIVGAEA
jgi:mRNA interferase MazF